MMDKLNLQSWVGREMIQQDVLAPFQARALAATLDRDDFEFDEAGTKLPPLWHWLYALDLFPLKDAGYDGHAATGGFLPPVPLPRRMWAGGRLKFHAPLRTGGQITKRSVVTSVVEKDGKSGPLVFVTVRHEISAHGSVSVEEEHDIVYRERPDAEATSNAAPPKSVELGLHSRTLKADPVLLFRYSALTFNGHRIHYDRDFCTNMEGYSGLVVHGPLLATLLLDHASRVAPDRRVAAFDFRAVAPVFDTNDFSLNASDLPDADEGTLWVRRHDGGLAMTAKVRFGGVHSDV